MSTTPCIYNYTYLDTPSFLSASLHMTSIITSPLHLFGFYCILWKTPETMKSVKWYLVNIHSWIILFDYSLGLMTIPYFLLPYLAGFPLGFLKHLGIPAEYQCIMMLLCLIYVVNSILAVFENRFYVVCTFSGKETWGLWRRPWLVAHYILMFFVMLTFLRMMPNQEIARKKVFEVCELVGCCRSISGLPCIPDYIHKDEVLVFSEDIVYPVLVFSIYVLTIFTECTSFVIYLVRYILHQLKQQKMSQKTYNLQRKFFIALVIQMKVPLVMLLFPFLYCWVTVYFRYRNSALTNIAVVIASMHGFCSTLTMLLIHHPYREAVLGLFAETRMMRMFEKDVSKVNIVSVGSTHT